jgi:hypothetical protein
MKSRVRGLLCAFPLLLGSLQCVEPLDAPSAYAEQRYLCTEAYASERAAVVERCREAYLRDRSCGGLVNFIGNIQSIPLVVESLASSASFEYRVSDTGVLELNMHAEGRTPYFEYTTKISNLLDGDRITTTTTGNDLRLNSLNATYRAQIRKFTFQLQLDTPDELAYTLSTRMTTNDTLEGCFHLFPTDR